VDRLTAVCFTASSAVHTWEFVYGLSSVGTSYQLHEPFVLIYSQWAVWYVMVRFTLEQRVFLYDTYVKYGFARKCRRKCRRKFRDERVTSRQTIQNSVNKLWITGLLIDKKQKPNRRVLSEEKSDDKGARLEHTPRKSLKRLAQETTQLLKLRPYKTKVIHALQLRDPARRVHFCSWFLQSVVEGFIWRDT
jgi:hypothetical protein